MKKFIKCVLFASVFFLFARSAYANIGAPMILVTLPCMVIGMIPISVVEGYVLGRKLSVSFKQTLKPSMIANLISTLIGIPITWIILVSIQIFTGGGRAFGYGSALQNFMAVTWQAPWLIPYESELYWMIPAATLVLLVPFFFASYLVELQIIKRILKQLDGQSLRSAVFVANVTSYAMLFALSLFWLITALISQGPI